MHKKAKRFVSWFLSICLLFCLTVPAAAETAEIQGVTGEIAGYIAEFFIVDNLDNPDMSWTEDSVVSGIVEMYDPKGAVSAYSAEIKTNGVDNGYIIISAYENAESLITEYSDASAPLYEELDVADEDQIVYCGALNYFGDDGSGELMTVDGVAIDTEIAEELSAEDKAVNSTPGARTRSKLGYGKDIDDPLAYANDVYGAYNLVCHEYRNAFENHCKFRNSHYYSFLPVGHWTGACGPIAVTNLIEMIGNYRNNSMIKSTNHEDIFDKVAYHGELNGYYSPYSGTGYAPELIKEGFRQFGLNATVTFKTATYANIKTEIDNNRPFYISLMNYEYYCRYDGNTLKSGHAVAGYAYTRFLNRDTGYYKSFVKIADGWASSGRYLDIGIIQPSHIGFLWTISLS